MPDQFFCEKALTNTPRGYIIKIPCEGIIEVVEMKNINMGNNNKCCCECKTTKRTDEEKKALINRLSRIEGQVRGLKGMVEKEAYCADILTQSAAVSAAVNSFNKELLASHIRGCVARDIRDGNDEVIDELVSLLQKMMK